MLDIVEIIGLLIWIIAGDTKQEAINIFNVFKMEIVIFGGFAIGIGIVCTALIAIYIILNKTQNSALVRAVMANSVVSGLSIIVIIWNIIQPGIFSAFGMLMSGMAMLAIVSMAILSSLDQRFSLMDKFERILMTKVR